MWATLCTMYVGGYGCACAVGKEGTGSKGQLHTYMYVGMYLRAQACTHLHVLTVGKDG